MDFNEKYTEPHRGLLSLSKERFEEAAGRQAANADNLEFWLRYSSEIFPNGLKAKEVKP